MRLCFALPSLLVLLLAVACGDSESTAGGAGGKGASSSGGGGTGGDGGQGGAPARPDPSGSRATAEMDTGRSHHTATLLENGHVIVIGGDGFSGAPLDSVERFDPETEAWSGLPDLPEPRSNHSTTLLEDGRLLVVGGARSNQNGSPSPEDVLSTAVVYDPTMGVVAEFALGGPRGGHGAFRLSNGDVLIAGGSSDEVGSDCTAVPNCQYGKALATVERFDAAAESWVAHPDLAGPRILFGATLLENGTPLLVGGASDTASLTRVEMYDANAEAFVVVAPLEHARFRPTVVSLGDGRVLAAAGKIANVGPIGVTELYDASLDMWVEGPEIGARRTGAAAATLQSGNALVVGGFNQETGDVLDELLVFDATEDVWVTLPAMVEPRSLPTATLLQDGRVLIVGGFGGLSSAEIAE